MEVKWKSRSKSYTLGSWPVSLIHLIHSSYLSLFLHFSIRVNLPVWFVATAKARTTSLHVVLALTPQTTLWIPSTQTFNSMFRNQAGWWWWWWLRNHGFPFFAVKSSWMFAVWDEGRLKDGQMGSEIHKTWARHRTLYQSQYNERDSIRWVKEGEADSAPEEEAKKREREATGYEWRRRLDRRKHETTWAQSKLQREVQKKTGKWRQEEEGEWMNADVQTYVFESFLGCQEREREIRVVLKNVKGGKMLSSCLLLLFVRLSFLLPNDFCFHQLPSFLLCHQDSFDFRLQPT